MGVQAMLVRVSVAAVSVGQARVRQGAQLSLQVTSACWPDVTVLGLERVREGTPLDLLFGQVAEGRVLPVVRQAYGRRG
jgi:hypothetical protein